MNKNTPILLTFPRSGSNYFTNYFYQSSSKLILKFHEYQDIEYFLDINNDVIENFNIVTIARNPADTIKSSVTMSANIKKNLTKEDIKEMIDETKDKYKLFYENNVSRINYVIDYETLLSNPKKVIEDFGYLFKIKTNKIKYTDNLIDNEPSGYIVSSKNKKHYDYVENIVSISDLDECLKLYKSVLSSKVMIGK